MYGADAVILIELSEPSSRIITMTKESNELAQRVELDLVEEEKEKARIKKETIKQQMARKYNKKVNLQEFKEMINIITLVISSISQRSIITI